MIPFEWALLAWIPVSFFLMLDRNSARGLCLAYMLGLLLLPAGAKIELSGIPDLNKENVIGIGVMLGTIIFHPHVFDRFRFSLADLLLIISLPLYALSSITNGFGVYDGISQANDFLLHFIFPVFLARLHFGTPQSLRLFLLAVVAAGVVCAPFALWEFRFSPQLHTNTYGYFQHQFAQHYRDGFWRPILFFSHALALGRFFAFAAFLALCPMRRDLVTFLGRLGNYIFLVPLFGLVLSQSYGPYMFFMLLTAGYFAVRRGWFQLVFIVPLIAFLWLGISMLGYSPGRGVLDEIQAINPDRAESLEYRLDAIEEYRSVIWNRPLFGYGGWSHGRIEGRATDSQALISLLFRGYLGTATYFAWWFCALAVAYSVMRRTHGTVFGTRAAAAAVLLALAISVTVIDAALDQHVLLIAAAVIAINKQLPATTPPALKQARPARHQAGQLA